MHFFACTNGNPFTGDWLSRTRLKTWENGTWSKGKGGIERGKGFMVFVDGVKKAASPRLTQLKITW